MIATGETHTVREFAEEVGKNLQMDIVWEGEGIEERGVDRKTGKTVINIDPVHFRPSEVDLLLGDSSKARTLLGWQPRVTFTALAKLMTDHDLKLVEEEARAGKRFEVKHFPTLS